MDTFESFSLQTLKDLNYRISDKFSKLDNTLIEESLNSILTTEKTLNDIDSFVDSIVKNSLYIQQLNEVDSKLKELNTNTNINNNTEGNED